MKKFILLLCVLSSFLFSGCAGKDIVVSPDQRTFTYVFDFQGKKKDELYIYARQCLSTSLNSSKDVIDYSDKEAGKIMGRALMPNLKWDSIFMPTWDIWFSLNIDIKDEKVRIVVNNIRTDTIISNGAKGGNFELTTKKELDEFKRRLDVFVAPFKSLEITNTDTW